VQANSFSFGICEWRCSLSPWLSRSSQTEIWLLKLFESCGSSVSTGLCRDLEESRQNIGRFNIYSKLGKIIVFSLSSKNRTVLGKWDFPGFFKVCQSSKKRR
jgi:hypothetical protein